MNVVDNALQFLEAFATKVPIELFVFFGSFIEEVIAPIPSPFVMTLTGSIAKAQDQMIAYILILSILGAIGKTLGAWILYIIADKAEDLIISKFGKFLGVNHKDIERIGKKLNKGWQDIVFLFIARALPIMPSAPVSVACGIVKINMKTYIVSTFFGTLVRNMMFLYVGYIGVSSYEHILGGLDSIESLIQTIIGIIFVGIIVWAYYKRRKTL